MKTALIISGGDYSPIEEVSYDYAIACDKGVLYAEKMGVKPDIIIGDFDSMSENIPECFAEIPVERYPVMKDDTDTMLAIKHALGKGFEHIVICSALGGRMDHLISNIQSLAYIAKNGGIGEIVSSNDFLRTFSAKEGLLKLDKKDGYSLSIYSLTDTSTGVCIRGALYEVEDAQLTNTFPLGHGNSFLNETVEISLKTGTLLIIESKLENGAHA